MMNKRDSLITFTFLCLLLLFSGQFLYAQETLEIDNDTLLLKLDLTRGGAINYISKSGTARNIVNIHDEGSMKYEIVYTH